MFLDFWMKKTDGLAFETQNFQISRKSMKIGPQKTEFQGEFGAGHEKNRKSNQKMSKTIIKLPGPEPDLSGRRCGR